MTDHAFLGNQAVGGMLPFNPDSVEWGINVLQASRDTIGGRVVQLLGVDIDTMTVTGVAASREALTHVRDLVRGCMNWTIDTQRPVHFRVPSRKWDFLVYPGGMPAIGWSLETVDYPYTLQLAVEDDLGIVTPNILHGELDRLSKGIGYSDAFSGGSVAGQAKILSYVQSFQQGGGSGGDGGAGKSTPADAPNPKDKQIIQYTPSGRTIQTMIKSSWQHFFGSGVAQIAMCVANRESGFHPKAKNHYGSGANYHIVRGLFQISDIHRGNWWYPANDDDLYDAATNITAAMGAYKDAGWLPWAPDIAPCRAQGHPIS